MVGAGYQMNWASELGMTRDYRSGTMTTAVTISDRAARRIGEILKGEGSGAMLRISVEGGGCSGFQYKFDIDRARAKDDLVDDLIGASFRVNNPNATASCGCGTSFSV